MRINLPEVNITSEGRVKHSVVYINLNAVVHIPSNIIEFISLFNNIMIYNIK